MPERREQMISILEKDNGFHVLERGGVGGEGHQEGGIGKQTEQMTGRGRVECKSVYEP